MSASYDNTVRLFDTQTGTAVLTIENMNKCRFSALCWHAAHQARPLPQPLTEARTLSPARTRTLTLTRARALG